MKDLLQHQKDIRRAAAWHVFNMTVLMVVVGGLLGAVFYFGLGGK